MCNSARSFVRSSSCMNLLPPAREIFGPLLQMYNEVSLIEVKYPQLAIGDYLAPLFRVENKEPLVEQITIRLLLHPL